MSPRTKTRSASKLRRDEHMMREMLAWHEANVPDLLRTSKLGNHMIINSMIKQAFMAGWKSRGLKDHDPVVPSRWDGSDEDR